MRSCSIILELVYQKTECQYHPPHMHRSPHPDTSQNLDQHQHRTVQCARFDTEYKPWSNWGCFVGIVYCLFFITCCTMMGLGLNESCHDLWSLIWKLQVMISKTTRKPRHPIPGAQTIPGARAVGEYPAGLFNSWCVCGFNGWWRRGGVGATED